MAAKKTSKKATQKAQPTGAKRVAAAFQAAQAAPDDEKWEIARRALVEAIEACRSADELEKLVRAAPVNEAFFEEAEAFPEVAHALARLARSLKKPDEGARVVGWLARAVTFEPSAVLRADQSPKLDHTRKHAFAAGFAAEMALFREWLVDASPERRSAAAHALGVSHAAKREDVRALLDAAGREKNAAALASELFGLGIVVFRSPKLDAKSRAEAKALGADKLRDKNALVRLTAAALLALAGVELGSAEAKAVLEHVERPVALPVEWGWHRELGSVMKSDWIAVALLCWAGLAQPETAVAALSKWSPGKAPLGFVSMVAEALVHLAYGARKRELPRHVLVASEADELERKVALHLGKEPFVRTQVGERKLGLPRKEAEVRALFQGEKLDYRPLPVKASKSARRWHFARIWAAVVFGEISAEAGRDSVVDGCSPDEALALVLRESEAKTPLYERVRTESEWERHFALTLGVMTALGKRSFDVKRALRKLASDPLVDAAALAVATLKEHGAKLPEDELEVVKRGLSAARSAEPLQGLLAALPEAVRCKILHATEVGGNSLRFMAGCLDEANVEALVLFATGPWGTDFADETLEVLARGGKPVIALLEKLEFEDEDTRAEAEPFVKRALQELRGKRPRR